MPCQINARTKTNLGSKLMKKLTTLLAATAIATLMAGTAGRKTFVFCSEGSPEGFDPASIRPARPSTAAAHTVYSRLLEFKKARRRPSPGSPKAGRISDDGLEYTFKLRPGVKFQTTEFFTPTRELNADDVISRSSAVEVGPSVARLRNRRFLGIFRRHGPAGTARVGRESRRHDGSRSS